MLSNEMDDLKEAESTILELELELEKIKKSLNKFCRRKKRNFTTGPLIKPVKFDNNSLKQQAPSNFVVFKALNNTSELQNATVEIYDLGVFATKGKVCKNQEVGAEKVIIFSKTIEVKPQSTVFLPVDITAVSEYEVQVLDVPTGMYFSTEFLPSTPIPTAQALSTSPNQNIPGAVIDSHIVTYSHQFVILQEPFMA